MARTVRLTPRFYEGLRACAVKPGSDASAALGATLAILSEASELPGLLDTEAMIPPTSRAFTRRVPGRNLWVWFRVTPDEVVAVRLTRTPPVPLDS